MSEQPLTSDQVHGPVRSALVWASIAADTLGYFPPALATAVAAQLLGDRNRRVGHFWASSWGRTALKLNPDWTIHVDDARMPKGRHFVVVANHESMADIIALFHLNLHFKWVAKEAVFKVPVMGWFMYMAGYIPLRRGDKASVRECMRKAREWLDRGVSVAFFPEGTRSLDGKVREFKPGAFKLAIDSGVDILPIAITGTRDALPKHSWRYLNKKSPMRVVVGEPIPTAGLTDADLPDLMARAREMVIALKAEAEGPPTAAAARRPTERRAAAL